MAYKKIVALPDVDTTRRLKKLDEAVKEFFRIDEERKQSAAEYTEALNEAKAKMKACFRDVHNPQQNLGLELSHPEES